MSAAAINWSSLTDEELLVYVELGNPAACRAAGERLREIVDVGYYQADEIANAHEEGRQDFSGELWRDFNDLLHELTYEATSLTDEHRKSLRDLRDRICSA